MEKDRENKPTDIEIKEWSEGNEHLEKLLIACRDNNVPSMFCCAGHDKKQPAYIIFRMNEDTIRKIYSIVNTLKNRENISLAFSRNPIFYDSKFAVYMYDENEKNSIMDSMAEATCREESLETLPENSQKLVEIAELLSDNRLNFDLRYYKGKRRSIYFTNYIQTDNKGDINKKITNIGFKLIENGANNQYFIDKISNKKECKVWEKVFNGIKNICIELNKCEKEDTSNVYHQRRIFKARISKNVEYGRLSESINDNIGKRDNEGIVERD